MASSEMFSQIERHIMEDVHPDQVLERLFAQPLPPEFDPLQRMKTTE